MNQPVNQQPTRPTPRLSRWILLVVLQLVGWGCATGLSVAEPPPAATAAGAQPTEPLLELFPVSGAPTFYQKPSELVLQKDVMFWQRDKKWHPELDEKTVFHATLQHRAVTERSWELGIGKGGQMYSLYSTFGEAMPPSSPGSQWNDEVWQFTTIYAPLLGNDLPENPADPTRQKFANAFVHQSGTYSKEKGSRPFYSPILAEHFDGEQRTYTVLSWGQIPSPSINRSGVLVYAQYRDLGAGVIELTYIIYNFEDEPMTNLGPWGGVRTSVFPEHVISNPNGSYRYFTPFHYGYDKLEGCRINFEDTGGWAAVTANADDPRSHALGVVFGKQLDRQGDHYGKPRYDVGDTRHGKRDYTVQATVIHVRDVPRTAHLLRMYFVIDTLKKVAGKANRLADHAVYQPLTFTEADTPRVPLYEERIPHPVATAAAVSSEYSKNYRAAKAIDGIRDTTSEWSSKGEQTPWIRVDLQPGTRVNRVVFCDKPNDVDNAHGGTLRFSDGTSVAVTGIPVDGQPLTVEFPARTVDWVKFEITAGEGNHVGLMELTVVSDDAGYQSILSRTPAGAPVGAAYAWPVAGSYPLFRIRNNETGREFLSADPYAQCAREPFPNPLAADDENHAKYENRTIYRPYLEQTDWIDLLGFVLPRDKADTDRFDYRPLAEIDGIAGSFDAGEKPGADRLLLRQPAR